ncbi:MAG: amidohydrolase family protein [Hyphomicrobiaceae bacterium]
MATAGPLRQPLRSCLQNGEQAVAGRTYWPHLGTRVSQVDLQRGSFSPGILDLFEAVDRKAQISDQRWLIEHVGMFNMDEVKRIQDLGLVLQAYSTKWIEQDGEALREKYGEAGAEQKLPMRDLIDSGIHVSLATDNVPPTLFAPISQVVTRKTNAGRVLGPGQAISRIEALACASREGAWLSFEENDRGTIEVGKFADLAILSDDLLEVDEARIPSVVADHVITAGYSVYERS